jgi:hypothetical protein
MRPKQLGISERVASVFTFHFSLFTFHLSHSDH